MTNLLQNIKMLSFCKHSAGNTFV